MFKRGKLPAAHDDRTICLRSVMHAITPVLPTKFNWDQTHPGCHPKMYLNDTYGDCVLAYQAEATDRQVLLGTGKPCGITDAEVKKQYFKETGGEDSGLVVLSALKSWHKDGWIAGGHLHKNGGFASVVRTDQLAIKSAIHSDIGIQIGVNLPESAEEEFAHGVPWSDTSEPGTGGHCIYGVGWNPLGLVIVTWGQYVTATWKWLHKYCDEMYAVLPELAHPKLKLLVDTDAFEKLLDG